MDKSQFLQRASDALTELALFKNKSHDLANVYAARGYGTVGGPNEIVQADLDASGINMTVAEFNTVAAPMFVDFNKFCDNVAVTAKNRGTELDKVRRDL